jgi:hypothetical protein
MGPTPLGPASDCTVSYRHVLLSEREIYIIGRKKTKNMSMGPKGGTDLTDRLTVNRKIRFELRTADHLSVQVDFTVEFI